MVNENGKIGNHDTAIYNFEIYFGVSVDILSVVCYINMLVV